MWDDLLAWLASLGEDHGVDPLIYAILYVGCVPLFLGSLAWLVRSIRRREPLLAPALATAVFFSLPALYVLVAGRSLPEWVYGLLIGGTMLGAIGIIRRIASALRPPD